MKTATQPQGKWFRTRKLFAEAIELEPDKRREFLRVECSTDNELLKTLESLVQRHFRLESEMLPNPGLFPARFKPYHELGSGTFGDVYKVHDTKHATDVAIKVLRSSDPAALLRFKTEFKRTKALSHPNIVKFHDWIEDAPKPMFTMEFVDGIDLLAHVQADNVQNDPSIPDSPRYSNTKLRDALRQLAEGVHTLHNNDFIHRDLKPRNVLVAQDGRVVILDLGLLHELTDQSESFAGTIHYMSPEQAQILRLESPSDWYSVGVMLYEALTGIVPFKSLSTRIWENPVPPRDIVPGVDKDLNDLCMGLLTRDPHARLGYPAIIDCVVPATHASMVKKPAQAVPTFVGRRKELEWMLETYRSILDGKSRLIHLCGPSGIGKSVLIREFLQHVRASDARALWFSSRCYAGETARYKGLDDLVDRICQHLRHVNPERRESLLPNNFAALARIFPVLSQLRSTKPGSPSESSPSDIRVRGFTALGEMLGRLAERHHVILVIDDFQWGDLDAAEFFRDFIFSPQAPPLLLVLAYRSEDIATSPWIDLVRNSPGSLPAAEQSVLTLGVLGPEDATALAQTLLEESHTIDDALLSAITEQTGRDPFLIHQVVRWMDSFGSPIDGREFHVEEILKDTIAALDPKLRFVLELVAVAGQPVVAETLNSIVGVSEMFEARDTLVHRKLLRSRDSQGEDEIEIYHDRIRKAVIDSLTGEEFRLRNEQLGNVFESRTGIDPERLFGYFRHAGHTQKASDYARQAAERAAAALAFNKAVTLYESALTLGIWDREQLCNLSRQKADALSNAGRGAEAADVYMKAAEHADPRHQMELTISAAGQLLRSGYCQQGIVLLEQLLSDSNVWFVRNRILLLGWILFLRLRIAMSGLQFQIGDQQNISADDRVKLDVYWAAITGLVLVDPIRSADFSSRYTLLALKAGDAYRLCLAVASEAVHLCLTSRRKNKDEVVHDLFRRSLELSHKVDRPHATAYVAMSAASIAYLHGDWRKACDESETALELLTSHCKGVTWEITTAIMLGFLSRFMLGQWTENRKRLPGLLKEAEARSDLNATLSFRMLGCAYVLEGAADRPSTALREIQADMKSWSNSTYDFVRCNALQAETDLMLYAGDAPAAWSKFETEWPLLSRSQLLRIIPTYVFLHFGRARAAIAMAVLHQEAPKKRNTFLRKARRDVTSLLKHGPPWSRGLGHLVLSELATFKRDRNLVIQSLLEAERWLGSANLVPFQMVVLYWRAIVENKPIDEKARAWFTTEEIHNPEKFVTAVAPGCWKELG